MPQAHSIHHPLRMLQFLQWMGLVSGLQHQFLWRKKQSFTIKRNSLPSSMGLLYSALLLLGFRVNSGEYKVMGLAPYGEAKYVDLIKENLISINSDGSFRLNMHYFDFCTGLTMTNKNFNKLMGGGPRKPNPHSLKKKWLAASIQLVTQEVVIKIAKNIRKETNKKNLCLAGGVALNCVANGILYKEKIFDGGFNQLLEMLVVH